MNPIFQTRKVIKIKYSNVILSDDNFDEELEKLCDSLKVPYDRYLDFVEKLDNTYSKQNNSLGFEEWVNQKVKPHYNPMGNVYPHIYGKLAYEFANGFIVLYYSEIDFYM